MGCTAVAMLPKEARGTLGKHITKPSEQVAAPPVVCLTPRQKFHDWPSQWCKFAKFAKHFILNFSKENFSEMTVQRLVSLSSKQAVL